MQRQSYRWHLVLCGAVILNLAAVTFGAAGPAMLSSTALAGAAEAPAGRPITIFVGDFELDAAPDQQEQSGRPGILPLRSLVPSLRRSLLGNMDDPKARAVELVNRMSDALVADLKEAGFQSRRLRVGEPYPARGWVVRGIFTEIDTGNRIRRAVIGFGVGGTEMQLQVAVSDLARHPAQAFYDFSAAASSGRGPGAIVFRNPYVAIAKLVLTKHAPERDVEKIARQITGELVRLASATSSQ
ncbi:DUF4410 domain-containing protein [Inquilinus limosus]|uniref:DUF4410 domain-containing protein n=1 Tax=Inquilinus limosus TaxID=171674 RepID=UPI003F152B36